VCYDDFLVDRSGELRLGDFARMTPELLGRLVEGDQESWGTFVREWSRRLAAFLRGLEVRECEIDEVAQDVFSYFSRKVKDGNVRYLGEKEFEHYMFRLAKWKARDWHRRRRTTARETALLQGDKETNDVPGPDATPDEAEALATSWAPASGPRLLQRDPENLPDPAPFPEQEAGRSERNAGLNEALAAAFTNGNRSGGASGEFVGSANARI
jgi:DNA-directed RNA polymerase specialized sigma24 family protein